MRGAPLFCVDAFGVGGCCRDRVWGSQQGVVTSQYSA